MSSRRNVMASGAIALFVAVVVIVAATVTGLPLTSTRAIGSTKGTLSILITDPPHIPSGVTAVYVAYSGIRIHRAGSGGAHDWAEMNSAGAINLLNTLNVSQTLASSKIDSGVYDKLLLNISSSAVTYNGKNYTAFVPSGVLFIPVVGGIRVNGSMINAAIINFEPTVVNVGSASNPEFVIRFVAQAFPVPSSEVNANMQQPGSKLNIANRPWWKHYMQTYSANIQLSSARLSASSLSITVTDTGNQNVTLKLLVVAPVEALHRSHGHSVPEVLSGASVFAIKSDGSLEPLNIDGSLTSVKIRAMAIFGSTGYELSPSASTTLSFNGVISLGFAIPAGVLPQTLTPGKQYLMAVVGENAISSLVVTSS